MNNENNIEKFEQLLKKEVSKQQITPPADVWSNIASQSGAFAGSSMGSQIASYIANLSSVIKLAVITGVLATAGVIAYTNLSKNAQDDSASTRTNNKTESTILESITDSEKAETSKTSNNPISAIEPLVGKEIHDEKNAVSEQPTAETSSQDGKTSTSPDTERLSKESIPETSAKNPITDSEIVLPKKTTYCTGEVIQITTNTNAVGNWSINGASIKDKSIISFEIKTSGVHHVAFYQGSSLAASKTFNVEVSDAKIIQEETSNKVFNFRLSDPTLNANWYIDKKQIGTNTPSVKHIVNNSGTYTITAQITNSTCFTAPVSSELSIKSEGSIEFFDFFSPNGDGKNDEYLVNISEYEHFRIQIVDLSNTLVFESRNPANGWNGRRLDIGELCPEGEYIAKISYQLRGDSLKTKTLRITLIRN